MKCTSRPLEDYRAELDRLALVLAGRAAPPADLPEETLRQMQVFALENREKRLQKLWLQLELVAPAFDDIEDLLERYADAAPQAAYAGFSEDAEAFLGWLTRSRRLSPEQRDRIACQRARHALEALARRRRREHLRFQELRARAASERFGSVAGELVASLEDNPGLVVHLNPCRAWARVRTPALLGEGAALPASLLLFARGNEVHTVALEPAGQALVAELEQFGPCTLDEWACRSASGGREELASFCGDLAELGLVAFS